MERSALYYLAAASNRFEGEYPVKASLRYRWRVLSIASLVGIFAATSGGSSSSRPPGPLSNETSEFCELADPSFITWFPKEFECPICKTKNIFLVVGSYGNYIYQDPSKYQLIFWPYTDSPGWYSCSKCHLSAFMGDFEHIPVDKLPDLRKALAEVTLPQQPQRSAKESLERPPYLDIPVSARMAVAEKVYRILGRDNDAFMNHFYRVVGYHAGETSAADEARKKSIAITERQLTDPSLAGQRKELLYILGAMRHFTGDDAGAKKAFNEASKEKYQNSDLKTEQNTGYDAYLTELINEYLEMLARGEGPRQKARR